MPSQQTVIELYRLKEDSTAIMVYLDNIERAEAVMLDLETTLVKTDTL